MLTEKEIKEIRNHLDNAKNPIFLFDNDPDGLCSFLILQRYTGRGKGVAIKSLPGLDKSYFRKVEEFKADYIFVLDKPLIDKEFIELADKAGIPLVHIDHHNVPKSQTIYYYNTFYSSGLIEPVSYLCYKITERKEDEWIAAIGCITDSFIPDFITNIELKYPGLIDAPYKTAFDILYKTTFGKICMIISFGIKDSTTNIVSLIRFLMKCNHPRDILEENGKTRTFLKRFNEINKKYQAIIKKAEEHAKEEILFFTYSGDLSINQYISNYLFYKYPEKIIVCIYIKGNIANLSTRWKGDIRTAVVNAIKGIEGASGGGHEHAAGGRIPADAVQKFKENLLKEIERLKKEKRD
ncbi:MAG: DHHA1 domain-containing protein [Candidatus Pacearchaeota archaeon]